MFIPTILSVFSRLSSGTWRTPHLHHRASLPVGPLRVLVADDEPANVFLAQAMLEQFGCTVNNAEDGLCAWSAWRDAAFDLLVLDLSMPGLGGAQMAERIRAEELAAGRSRVPIVLYTAYPRDEVEALLDGATFDAYLGKPLDRSELQRVIELAATSSEGGR
ncbi:MAG: response regulator [Oceanicaulis sp.]